MLTLRRKAEPKYFHVLQGLFLIFLCVASSRNKKAVQPEKRTDLITLVASLYSKLCVLNCKCVVAVSQMDTAGNQKLFSSSQFAQVGARRPAGRFQFANEIWADYSARANKYSCDILDSPQQQQQQVLAAEKVLWFKRSPGEFFTRAFNKGVSIFCSGPRVYFLPVWEFFQRKYLAGANFCARRPHLEGVWRAQISRRFAFYLWPNRDSCWGYGMGESAKLSHISIISIATGSKPRADLLWCEPARNSAAETIFNFIACNWKSFA